MILSLESIVWILLNFQAWHTHFAWGLYIQQVSKHKYQCWQKVHRQHWCLLFKSTLRRVSNSQPPHPIKAKSTTFCCWAGLGKWAEISTRTCIREIPRRMLLSHSEFGVAPCHLRQIAYFFHYTLVVFIRWYVHGFGVTPLVPEKSCMLKDSTPCTPHLRRIFVPWFMYGTVW